MAPPVGIGASAALRNACPSTQRRGLVKSNRRDFQLPKLENHALCAGLASHARLTVNT